MSHPNFKSSPDQPAFIITGPTSGIGYATALELAQHGPLILTGRNPEKLEALANLLRAKEQQTVSVCCDLSDMTSVRRAVQEIKDLKIPIRGLLNNAGIMPTKASKNKQGWDLTYATNFLGPFLFTEALLPHLPDGANVAFIGSAIEDPERKPAKAMGMRGGRYISAAASARGEWLAGGSKMAGVDAYATSKQCVLAATLGYAREIPRLHFNAIEPGITPGTGLGGDASALLRAFFGQVITRIPPFAKYRSTPQKAAKMIAKVMTDTSGTTGIYYDEKGYPMQGSDLAREVQFQDRVMAETRAFLAKFYS